MADRKTIAHELGQRAKAVGWKVTTPRSLTGAYKVFMSPCGNDLCNHQMQIHLTSSDVNARHVIMREFDAHGFTGLEKKVAERAEKERQAKIDADRRRNDAATERIDRTATMVAKAAGPYAAPEYVPNEWFTQKHPGIGFKWVIVTPAQARWVLKNCNKDNRPLRRATAEHYRNVIRSQQWHRTHQGMAIDEDGNLQDGQHRLEAIGMGEDDVPVAFFVGMPRENFKAIDEGLLRTAAQLLAKGGESNTRTMTAVVKLSAAFSTADRNKIKMKVTNENIIDGFQMDADEIRRATVWGMRYAKKSFFTPSALASARYLIRRTNGTDNPYVEAFFRGLITMRKIDRRLALEDRDPRVKLREYVMNVRAKNKRTSGFDQLCMIVMVWNYVLENYRPAYLRWAENQPVPKISIIPYSEGLALHPSCPPLLEGEVAEPAPEAETEPVQQELIAA